MRVVNKGYTSLLTVRLSMWDYRCKVSDLRCHNEGCILTVSLVLGIGCVAPLINKSEDPVSSCTE